MFSCLSLLGPSRQVDVDVAAVPESREDVEADGVPVVANVVVLSEEEDVVAPNANLEMAGSENINCILFKISFTGSVNEMPHRKWREIDIQPSCWLQLALPGWCLFSPLFPGQAFR